MLRDYIPKRIRNRLHYIPFFKSPVAWANWGILSKYLAKKNLPLTPPVIILSSPRSGSSWVGNVLSLSPTALYLREPITQKYQQAEKKRSPITEVNINNLPHTYEKTARKVFSALPAFERKITTNFKQWSLSKRQSRRLVIKEVNPFMLSWFIQEYRPRIIYLLRHPVAVTYSFERRGWTGKKLEPLLSKETLIRKIPHYKQFTHSFWAEYGAFQAFLLNETLTAANGYQDFKVVKYEDLCADPLNEYKELYDFAQLEWNETVQQEILKHCQPEQVDHTFFSTQRNSAYEMDKWKNEVPLEKILELKQAYLSFNPAYYQDDWPE